MLCTMLALMVFLLRYAMRLQRFWRMIYSSGVLIFKRSSVLTFRFLFTLFLVFEGFPNVPATKSKISCWSFFILCYQQQYWFHHHNAYESIEGPNHANLFCQHLQQYRKSNKKFQYTQLFFLTMPLIHSSKPYLSIPPRNSSRLFQLFKYGNDRISLQYFCDLNKEQKMAGDSQAQGKKLNGYSDVQHGPMSQANRECRDIICLLMFAAMVVAMIAMSSNAYSTGNISKVFRATDSNGVACGDPTGVAANYPYAYFYNPTSGDLSNRYCVTSCPYYSSGSLTTISCYGQVSCAYALTVTSSGTYSVNPSSTSQIIGYETSAMVGRLCIPSTTVFNGVFSSYVSTFSSALSSSDLASFTTDLQNNWKWILAAIGGCVIIAFIFMYTLRCFAGLIVWTSVIGIILVLTIGGLIFLYNAGIISSSYATTLNIPTISGATKTQYQALGYTCLSLAGLFFIIFLCCFSRIRLAVAVCKAAGQFVAHTCSVVLVPIIQATLVLGMWAACLVAMLYLISCTNFVGSSGSVFTSVESYTSSSLQQFYAFVFGTLWCNALIQAAGTFVVASACCIWYYSHGPDQDAGFPVFRSYKMAIRYHLGSLAFGSLILAIVQFVQLMVEAFKKQAEAAGGDNKIVEYITNCLRCCLQCVERIVQFINKMAYIQIALRGKGFCQAAKDGFEVAWSNPLRFAIVGGVGEVIMFLGKLMIAGGTTFGFYVLITFVSSIQVNVLKPIYLLIVVFIISYAIGMLFMSVYSIAMDTILQCFIVDEANQQSKGAKTALYAPQELQDLIDKAQ